MGCKLLYASVNFMKVLQTINAFGKIIYVLIGFDLHQLSYYIHMSVKMNNKFVRYLSFSDIMISLFEGEGESAHLQST